MIEDPADQLFALFQQQVADVNVRDRGLVHLHRLDHVKLDGDCGLEGLGHITPIERLELLISSQRITQVPPARGNRIVLLFQHDAVAAVGRVRFILIVIAHNAALVLPINYLDDGALAD